MSSVTGVLIMKEGLAWGEKSISSFAAGIQFGWVEPEVAIIYNAEFVYEPTDVTHMYSPYIEELRKGTLVKVKRTIIVEQEEVQHDTI